MSKPQPKNTSPFLKNVYHLNGKDSYANALQKSYVQLLEINLEQWEAVGLNTYAPNKWTIHQIIQHLIDWERIWCYRAVIMARNEGSIPDGHDQEIMSQNSNANELPLNQLIEEIKIVRQSTLSMFKSFNQEMLEKLCIFFEYEMPLSAIGLTITAHQIHHFRVIEDRYLPLAKS